MSNGISKEVAREILSPEPSQMLEFFLIYYAWPEDQENFIALTPIANFGQEYRTNQIVWQGVAYISVALKSEGFNLRGDGDLVRPRLTIANYGAEVSKYLKTHNNLIGAKVIRKRTFVKFLDDVNFSGGENPYFDLRNQASAADENAYLPDQVYYVNRRVAENKSVVELELSSVLEVENVFVPNRNTYARYCTWVYRGQGCQYRSVPKTTSNSQSFKDSSGSNVSAKRDKGEWKSTTSYAKGDYVFVQTDNYFVRDDRDTDAELSEKLKTYYVCVENGTAGNANFPPISPRWQRDECAKKISDCKLRFGGGKSNQLPYGGFPGCHQYPPNSAGK